MKDFRYFLILKCRQNRVELNEDFIAMWREEQSLLDVIYPLYRARNEEDKSLKRISDKFQISDMTFSNKVLFQMQKVSPAYPGDS